MKKSIFIFGCILTLLYSCNEIIRHKSSPDEDILYAHIDTLSNPADDYFQYSNGRWLKANPIPDDETSWGIAHLVEKELYDRKLKINLDAAQKSSASGTELMIGNFWKTAMDSNSIEKQGIQPLKELLSKIEACTDKKQLLLMAGELHKIGVGVFFSEGVSQDEKNSNAVTYHLMQGGIGMPNRDYYFKTDDRSTKVRNAYPVYLSKMFSYLGTGDSIVNKNKALAVYNFELKLAKASRTIEAMRDPIKNYNKVALSTFQKTSANIDWSSVFTTIGISHIDTLIVGQPEFYTALSNVLLSEPLQNLKDYMAFHLTRTYASCLSQNFVRANFEFYNQLIRGQKKEKLRWKRVLDAEESVIGEPLGQLFAKEYFNDKAKNRYSNLVEDIRMAFKERIEKLDWMSDSTKQKALHKLAVMQKKVGYPDKWKDYTTLTISTESFAKNMMNANAWENQREINKLGKPVDRTEWDMTPQTYNAYYNPSNNEIVLPAGQFTVPGYKDEDLDDALVYGYAAASTIGHEITHGFDDEGRQFDDKGNLHDWWSKEDAQKFNERAAILIKQFNKMVVVDTLKINGKATLGENLADLGGVLLGVDAFKKSAAYKENKAIAGLTPLQRFFLGYSLGWLYNQNPNELAARLMTDVHSPAKQRVNGPLPNVPAFYEAYKITPQNKLYISEKDRVHLW